MPKRKTYYLSEKKEMRPELFIANRLYFDKEGQKKSSRPAVKVALIGMIIGVLVMVLTLCVVVGFKRTITDKVACFGAHIQLSGFESNNTFERAPIEVSDSLLQQLSAIPNVSRVETFLTKPGIIKTEDSFQGVVLKGKDSLVTMASQLVAGRLPETEQEVLLSQRQCQLLRLGIGDKVYCYFVGEDVRVRRFAVSGVYATGLQESDELFVWCKSNVIRRLNEWDCTQVSGVEMSVKDVRKMDENGVFDESSYFEDEQGKLWRKQLLDMYYELDKDNMQSSKS